MVGTRIELIAWIMREIKNCETASIPHHVLSHGFMEWLKFLPAEMKWRGQKVEEEDGFTFDTYMRVLYERFFILVELIGLESYSKEAKRALKDAGWQAYLDD